MGFKNLLIVSAGYTYGGLETNIAGQVRQFTNAGIHCHFAIGEESIPKNFPIELVSSHLDIPFRSAVSNTPKNEVSRRLVEIIKTNNIDMIHAHPFHSIIPSYLAAKTTGTPLAITLHGPASVTFGKDDEDKQQFQTALRDADIVFAVSEEVRDLANKYGIKTQLAPNFVPVGKTESTLIPPGRKKWLIVSRIDGVKWFGIAEFLKCIRSLNDDPIAVVGDGERLERLVEIVNEHRFENIEFLGRRFDVDKLMLKYDIVGGMGRVALESLSLGKPLFLIGYKGGLGFVVTKEDAIQNARVNFSGRGFSPLTVEQMKNHLKAHSGVVPTGAINYVRNTRGEIDGWKKILCLMNTVVEKHS